MKASDMTKATISVQRRLLSIQDVADHLAISIKSVRRLIACGSLHTHRIGRTIRVSEEDLRLYLTEQRR